VTAGRRNLALWRGVASLLVGVVLWELVARFVVKSTLIIVPPSHVVTAFVDLLRQGELQTHVYVSGLEFLSGFGLAAVVGVVLGLAIGVSDVVRDVLEPWLSALYATPVVAFAPLFVVWMGIGPSSKVAVAFLLAVLPIIINTSAGIRTTDQNLVDVARSFSATRGQIFFKILIPYALAFIIAGLRLGVGRAIIGVVVAEMLTSSAGIGYLVTLNRTILDSPRVFAAILAILVLSIAYYMLARALENRMVVWQSAGRQQPSSSARGATAAVPAPAAA